MGEQGDGTVPGLLSSGDGTALACPVTGRNLTYDGLADLTERIARQLAGAGLAPGDTVAAAVGNGPEAVVAFLGVLRAGAAFAPLNPAYTGQEFDAYLRDLAPRAMLFGDGTGDVARPVCATLDVACLDLDETGLRGLEPSGGLAAPDPEANRARTPHQRHDERSQGRLPAPPQPRRLGPDDRRRLRPRARRRVLLRDAALPRARPRRFDPRHARHREAPSSCRRGSAPRASGTTSCAPESHGSRPCPRSIARCCCMPQIMHRRPVIVFASRGPAPRRSPRRSGASSRSASTCRWSRPTG